MLRWTLPALTLSMAAAQPAFAAPAATTVIDAQLAKLALASVTTGEVDENAIATKATRLAVAPIAFPLAVDIAFVASPKTANPIAYRFGPFEVTSPDTASLVGATDAASPQHFSAMMRAFPEIDALVMVEAPGTYDDRANLSLGRMIHEADIATIVPARGSVRSGAVDLFMAGTRRIIEEGAEFAVHSWRDDEGREASDYAHDRRRTAPISNIIARSAWVRAKPAPFTT